MINIFIGFIVIRKKKLRKGEQCRKCNCFLVFNVLEVGYYENVGGFVMNMCIFDDIY